MMMNVRDIMTLSPITIDPETSLGTAMALMRDKGVRHLPVVDDAGRLVGIITDRDLRSAAFATTIAEYLSLGAERRLRGLGQALEDLRVKDAMTWDVVTTQPDAGIAHAAAVMFEGRCGSLPVVENGKLIGILTERDLLGTLAGLTPDRKLDLEGFLW